MTSTADAGGKNIEFHLSTDQKWNATESLEPQAWEVLEKIDN